MIERAEAVGDVWPDGRLKPFMPIVPMPSICGPSSGSIRGRGGRPISRSSPARADVTVHADSARRAGEAPG